MYRYELHLHTKETSACAGVAAKDIPHLYKEAGYDGIVVTDHYAHYFFERNRKLSFEECIEKYLSGYFAVKKEALKIGLTVMLGMEITLRGIPNDYLVYGIDESFLFENPKLYAKSVEDFSKLARKKGLFFAQAHPFRWGMIRSAPHLLDGIEVFNGNARADSRNDMTYEYADANGLIGISGSDFHQLEDLARGGIVTEKPLSTSEELADYLKTGKFEIIGGAS